jgi:hypothetical protein
MDSSPTSLFDVYLRLRPSFAGGTDRFLDVEPADFEPFPKHITIKPPVNDHRKRAVEKFAFTRVFEEDANQLDIFRGTGVMPLLEGVLGTEGSNRDGLLATLGVTGSGKVNIHFKGLLWLLDSNNKLVESYNSRIKITTGYDTDGIGCAIPEHFQ